MATLTCHLDFVFFKEAIMSGGICASFCKCGHMCICRREFILIPQVVTMVHHVLCIYVLLLYIFLWFSGGCLFAPVCFSFLCLLCTILSPGRSTFLAFLTAFRRLLLALCLFFRVWLHALVFRW